MADIGEVLVVAVLHILLEDASGNKQKKKKACEREEPPPRPWRSRSASVRGLN